MKIYHPSDLEIQQFALHESEISAQLALHIESCDICLEEVARYQVVFSVLKKERSAAFDFNLSELVVAELPATRQVLNADRFVAGFLVFFVCSFAIAPLYLFRTYILNMFSGISLFFVYATTGSAAAVIAYKTLELYKKYKNQIRLLNLN